MKRRLLLPLAAVLVPAVAGADLPAQVHLQGYITDHDATPVDEMELEMVFAIYDVPDEGDAKWSEKQIVDVVGGFFGVTLGTVRPLPSELFSRGEALYIGVSVQGDDAEMHPRSRIGAVPYAFHAITAERVLDLGPAIGHLASRAALDDDDPQTTPVGWNDIVRKPVLPWADQKCPPGQLVVGIDPAGKIQCDGGETVGALRRRVHGTAALTVCRQALALAADVPTHAVRLAEGPTFDDDGRSETGQEACRRVLKDATCRLVAAVDVTAAYDHVQDQRTADCGRRVDGDAYAANKERHWACCAR